MNSRHASDPQHRDAHVSRAMQQKAKHRNKLCVTTRCHPLDATEESQKRFVFFMMRKNSSSLTSPSPSLSASSIIRSPSSFATRFKFLKEILPVLSSSKRRKAF